MADDIEKAGIEGVLNNLRGLFASMGVGPAEAAALAVAVGIVVQAIRSPAGRQAVESIIDALAGGKPA